MMNNRVFAILYDLLRSVDVEKAQGLRLWIEMETICGKTVFGH